MQHVRVVNGVVAEAPMILPEGMALAEMYGEAVVAACFEAADAVRVGWITADGGKTFAPPVIPAPTAAALTTYAAAKRYTVETGGIVVNGAAIATDRESQAMIGNAYAYVQASGAASVSYKTTAGFATLTAEQVKAVALAVGAHVQACFAAEDAADAAINASPPGIATYAQVDAAFAALSPTA